MADLRYPIGQPAFDQPHSIELAYRWIEEIRSLPSSLEAAVDGLTESQLDTPYRKDGWTVRQVVHHLADSHINAHVRFRLTLTEDHPTIRPYEEKAWAELSDARAAPVGPSLTLIRALHDRWARLLETLEPDAFERTMHHPEWGDQTLWYLLENYQWHGRHHVAHITELRKREGW